jgi:hypothetical protein
MREVARIVKWLIWGIAGALAVLFGFVKLGNFPYSIGAEYLNPDLTRDFLIAIYYTCWVFGCKSDTVVQEQTYSRSTGAVFIPTKAIVYIILFGALAAVVLYFVNNDTWFTLALDCFLVANILGFMYILRFVGPSIRISHDEFRKNNDVPNTVKLEIVMNYFLGVWQWVRFAVGALILIALTLVVLDDTLKSQICRWVASKIGFQEMTVKNLIADTLIASFIAVMEGWIWSKRVVRAISIRTIDRLAARFRFDTIRA